ncbi:MAG: Endonuclease III [Verrucomicrobia subdivision 3 bacterium]|nr:Endonuclease III [Limisphaerales bacterium]MCS1416650.1 Endonuclease III [Limisphaerales bacterium]
MTPLPKTRLRTRHFFAPNYNLHETLTSGQAFRWKQHNNNWIGIIQDHWVRLSARPEAIIAATTHPEPDWNLLKHYLQTEVDITEVTDQFPQDQYLRTAISKCCGLRLLRQNPWECLASFILSSTKQILHISKIIEAMAAYYKIAVTVPDGYPEIFQFPTPEAISQTSENQLRRLKMGYRAPYLKASAKAVAEGTIDPDAINHLPYTSAKESLIQLPGVGPKIADCVLLFAYGKQEAFPIDIWVDRALRELYFPRQQMTQSALESFVSKHFAPYNGYAQQYLFHYMRTKHTPP